MQIKAIADANYHPGEAEEVQAQSEKKRTDVSLNDEGNYDYDYIIIGSGGAAFSSAIEAVTLNAKVAMIERGTVGGTSALMSDAFLLRPCIKSRGNQSSKQKIIHLWDYNTSGFKC